MFRNVWTSALTLGAVLAMSGAASAAERDTLPLSRAGSGTTMTLGGKGTAAQAASEDTELTHGYRYGYRGYYGGYGYGYRGGWGGYYGGYYSGYRGYYGGYSSFSYYRPAYYSSYYYARPYYSSFYYPAYYPTYYSYGPSIYLGIGGDVLSDAPTITLGSGFAPSVPPMGQPAKPGNGTFPYDGGPSNPVPLPKGEPQMIPPANPSSATDLPISLKPKAAPTPYKYKAYGEK